MKKLIGKIKNKISRIKNRMRAAAGAFLKKFIEKYYKYLPINKRKVVFDNFAGRGYGEHPKYIAEEIHRRNLSWKIIWLVKDKNEPMPSWIHKVQFGSWRSLYHVATAKMWVDNIRNAHLLPKRDGQVFLQTWHGAGGLKLVEGEVEQLLSPNYVEKAKYDGSIADAIISSYGEQTKSYRDYFWLSEKTEILEIGGPRDDCLFDSQFVRDRNQAVREKLHIEPDDFVVLYAPTFRDDGSTAVYQLDFKVIADVFAQKTGKTCRILIRLHPNVKAKNLFQYNEWIIDGNTAFEDANDSVICCDALITDFSSIWYEAALLRKISFRYAEDYDEYVKHRTLSAMEKEMPIFLAKNLEEFMKQVKTVDFEQYKDTIQKYMQTLRAFDDGNASKRAVDWLVRSISH